jgi:hypothetical protein
MIVDDVYSPNFLLTGKVKAAVTAKVNVNRVKHDQGNAENDNHNTLLSNGNEYVPDNTCRTVIYHVLRVAADPQFARRPPKTLFIKQTQDYACRLYLLTREV